MKKSILVIDDDLNVCWNIKDALLDNTTDVFCVKSVTDAIETFQKREYCLAVIAAHLSRYQDIEVIRTIRNTQKIPIIVLADRLTTMDEVMLFQAGANACIETSVDLAVCAAQAISLIHLYLEAKEKEPSYQPKVFGRELIINTLYRQIIVDGELLDLTRIEYEIFICLAAHPYQIWSPTQLYRYVWNDTLGLTGGNTVRTHIGNIKKKLEKLGKNYIQNSRGVGYKFVPPP